MQGATITNRITHMSRFFQCSYHCIEIIFHIAFRNFPHKSIFKLIQGPVNTINLKITKDRIYTSFYFRQLRIIFLAFRHKFLVSNKTIVGSIPLLRSCKQTCFNVLSLSVFSNA